MKIVEEQKHFLALQDKPGDNIYIDISKLKIANHYCPSSLAEIDSFTMHFTTEEIMEAIRSENIVEERYLDGLLCIVDNQKHNPIEVMTKDYLDGFEIESFIRSIIGDKNLVNSLINKFGSVSKDEELTQELKNALNTNLIGQVMYIIFSLPYLTQRKYMVYLIEQHRLAKQKEFGKEIELLRDRAA